MGGTAGIGTGGAGGDGGGGTADAAAGGAGGGDAGADASDGAIPPACDLTKPFSTPTAVASFNSAQSDDGLWISDNGLTAYISSSRTGGPGSYDIFRAVRTSTTAAWGQFSAVPNINSTSLDRTPILSPDGLTLFFYSNRVNGGGDYDIFAATRTNLLADFATAAPVAGLNSTGREDTGSITSDGRTLYFDSDKSGMSRIYRATLGASGAFMTPELVGELDATMGVSAPVISADGLTIFLSGATATTNGPSDIYVAHRSTTADGFGAIAPVTELNSAGRDFPDWLSADGCTILSRERSPRCFAHLPHLRRDQGPVAHLSKAAKGPPCERISPTINCAISIAPAFTKWVIPVSKMLDARKVPLPTDW